MNIVVYNLNANETPDLYNKFKEEVYAQSNAEINPSVTYEIRLSAGNYIVSKDLEFKCNVRIIGEKGTKVSVTNFSNLNDDGLIRVKGLANKKLKLEVRDVEFDVAQQTSSVAAERFYFKAVYCDSVVFRNISIYLQGYHSLTNIDMRCCSNILVENCVLTNYNNSEAGGVLWIRGNTSNVHIKNNTIRKHGNDEAIAIWGSGNTGESVESVNKQNILIENNRFEYGQPGGYPSYGINKFITLFENPSDREIPYRWSNIKISNNYFEISDLTKNLIYLSFGQPDTTVEGVRIENNTIRHLSDSNNTGYIYTGDNDYERDIVVLSKSDNDVYVRIQNNEVVANHLDESQLGNIPAGKYVHLVVDGAKVMYESNKLNTNKVLFADILSMGGELDIKNNDIRGLSMLCRASLSSTSTDSILPVTLNIHNNKIEGDTRIFCRKVRRLDLHMSNNQFISDSYYLLLQNFGFMGSLIARNNIWERSVKNTNENGTIYGITETSIYLFEKIVFVGNIFESYTQSQISALPSATTKIVENNVYKQ